LPVDHEGFLAMKEQEIRADLERRPYSFEASPFLSLSLVELHERFGAKFVMLMRRPDGVVSSFAHKGFYKREYQIANAELATGYQDQSPEHLFTFFARISPRGEYVRTWNQMTPVGKVAWFWRAANERSLQILEGLPKESYKIIRIEDVDYPGYLDMCRFLGIESKITESTFDAIRKSKPHANWRKRNVDQWTEREIVEYESQVGTLAESFGYKYRVADLVDEARAEREESIRLGRIPQPKQGIQFWRLRRATAKWLREIATSVDVS
jgi:hypothetical protein